MNLIKVYRILDSIAVISIMLDWLPLLLGGRSETGAVYSGTRFIGVPLVIVGLLIRIYDLRRAKAILVLVLLSAFGMIFVANLGLVDGSFALRMIPSLLYLIWFALPRPLDDVRRLLLLAVWCSIGVGVSQVLASLNLVENVFTHKEMHGFTRTFAATSTGDFGIYVAVAAGTLGGLPLLGVTRTRWTWLAQGFCAVVFFLGIYNISTTVQRSSALCYIVGVIPASISYFRHFRQFAFKALLITACVAFLMALIFHEAALSQYENLLGRVQHLSDSNVQDTSSFARLDMVSQFGRDISSGLDPFGPGQDSFERSIGTIPHFVPGQAYYNGGWPSLIAWALLLAGSIAWPIFAFPRAQNPQEELCLSALLGVTAACLLQAALQPCMTSRVYALVIGLAFCVGHPALQDRPRTGGSLQGRFGHTPPFRPMVSRPSP